MIAEWTGWANTDDEAIETTDRKSAILFISHTNVTEQIIATLTELHNCGHFSYSKFDRVVPSFAELQTLTDLLKFELLTWKAAMSRARGDFLCLNFFRSVELRLIVEELMHVKSTQPEERLEQCLDLCKWTGVPSIDLEAVKRLAARSMVPQSVAQIFHSSHDGKDHLIYNCLRIISGVMESSIFQRKFVKNSAESKGKPRIVLADVDDSQCEIDAVATLFAERKLVLHGSARNVIVCGPRTAWEDLYLLTLRYLNNVGQGDYFFCVAYIERLSFDCLAQLLALLQKLVHEYPVSTNELALVSCSRSKILQTLSQRLQVLQAFHADLFSPLPLYLLLDLDAVPRTLPLAVYKFERSVHLCCASSLHLSLHLLSQCGTTKPFVHVPFKTYVSVVD